MVYGFGMHLNQEPYLYPSASVQNTVQPFKPRLGRGGGGVLIHGWGHIGVNAKMTRMLISAL